LLIWRSGSCSVDCSMASAAESRGADAMPGDICSR
jgi:hypothetical protein